MVLRTVRLSPFLKEREERPTDQCDTTFASSLCSPSPEIEPKKCHKSIDLYAAGQQAAEGTGSTPGFCCDSLKAELLTWTRW